MKIFKFLSILFCLFLALPAVSHAETVALGDFSPTFSTEMIPVDWTLSVDGKNYTFSRSDVLSLIEETASLALNSDHYSEMENPNFCLYNKSLTCLLTLSYSNYGHVQKIYARNFNEENIETFLQNLAQKTDTGPVNAKLQMQDGKVSVFDLSSPGVQLDIDKSKTDIAQYINQGDFNVALALPVKKIDPTVSTNSIENLGINTLIGEGVSDFKGSTKNRIFNINTATTRFNGVLIKPGEEFSFVQTLGPVDAEHDYLPELVIKNNVTEPEFGGGICQVSTTAFRAAIYSGLKITARRNHAYPVSYYNPQGMDSTVYIPNPDLKFINDTPGYILIQTRIEGTQLFFDFYGTSDGRSVKVIGPTITERGAGGALKATFTQEIYSSDNSLVRSDVFNSVYASPSKYPHPGQEPVYTQKPADWSKKEWNNYAAAHGL